MDLYDELAAVIDLLERRSIDYALCGGMAVAFHGYARFTKDIDLLVRREDIDRLSEAVRELGFTVSTGPMPFGIDTEHPREVHRISKLGDDEVLSLDLVVVTPQFEVAWSDREVYEWHGRRLKVVSAEGLATMKKIAGRDQDLLDLKMLGFDLNDDEKTEDP